MQTANARSKLIDLHVKLVVCAISSIDFEWKSWAKLNVIKYLRWNNVSDCIIHRVHFFSLIVNIVQETEKTVSGPWIEDNNDYDEFFSRDKNSNE